MRKRLQALIPEATWEEIKARFPAFVSQWKPGYEPKPLDSEGHTRLQAGSLARADTPPLELAWL
jgi:hypothetical protein